MHRLQSLKREFGACLKRSASRDAGLSRPVYIELEPAGKTGAAMSRPPRHRGAIVRAAATLFRRNGYAATGINEIAEVSGAPKGSLYHYFPNGKEQIAEAAVRFAGAGVVATLEKLAQE